MRIISSLEVTVLLNIELAQVFYTHHIQPRNRHMPDAASRTRNRKYNFGLGIYIGINPNTDETNELKHELGELSHTGTRIYSAREHVSIRPAGPGAHYLCQAMVSAVRSLPHSHGYRPPPRQAARATYFT